MATINDVLQSNQKLNEIQNRLFNVVLEELTTNHPNRKVEGQFGVYKANEDEQFQLGIVGTSFTPNQPKALFDVFINTCLKYNLDVSKIEFFEMYGGKKIRFRVPLKDVSFINLRGVEDVTKLYLSFQTGFDGKTAASIYIEAFRMACANGVKKTFTEFKAKFKNVKGNNGKIVGLIENVTKVIDQTETLEQMYINLNDVKVDQATVNDYIEKVFNYNLEYFNQSKAFYSQFTTEYKKGKDKEIIKAEKENWLDENGITADDLLSQLRVNNITKIYDAIDVEFEGAGETAFALLNGITRYTNHVVKKETDYDFIIVGQGAKTNDKALKEILKLSAN